MKNHPLIPLLGLPCLISVVHAESTNESVTLDAMVISSEAPIQPFSVSKSIKKMLGSSNDGAELLKQTAGVSVSRQGGTASDPLLRGLGGTRLNISIDGVPFGGVCNHRMDPATAYVSPSSFDSLSLLKGPQSVKQGNNIAGTVNFDREEIRYDELGMRNSANYLYGSFNQQNLSVDSSVGYQYGYIGYSHNNARGSNYEDGNGNTIKQSFYDTSNDRVAVGFTPDDETLFEISGLVSDGVIGNATIHMDVTKLDRENYSMHFKKENISDKITQLDIRYSYTQVDHDMDNFSVRELRPFHEYILMGQYWERHFAKAELVTQLTDDIEWLSGVEYQHDSYDANAYGGFMEFDPPPSDSERTFNHILDFDTVGAYSELNYQMNDQLRWVVGLRGNSMGTRTGNMHGGGETSTLVLSGANQHRRQALIAGFMRAEYQMDELPITMSAGYGHAERAADYWEVYSMDGFELDEERNDEIDAMVSYQSESLTAEASAFYSYISDFILVHQGDSAANINAQRVGGELNVAYQLTDEIQAIGNLSYVYGQNLSQHTALAQTPPLESTIGLNYQSKLFNASFKTRLVDNQNRFHKDYGNVLALDSTATEGFIVSSLQLGYTPHPMVELKFGVDNLFNKTYSEHLNRSASASVGGPSASKLNEVGRSFWGRISINFDYPKGI